jgi:DNA-binding CsgD family transcriptional regulator
MAPPKVPEGCPLTPRQYQTIKLLCDGQTRSEIADTLALSRSTIRTIHHEALRRLRVSSLRAARHKLTQNLWWEPDQPDKPLRDDQPFLVAYLQEFERSRWPNEPDTASALGMELALAGHRNQQRRRP